MVNFSSGRGYEALLYACFITTLVLGKKFHLNEILLTYTHQLQNCPFPAEENALTVFEGVLAHLT